MIPFVGLRAQYQTIKDEIDVAIRDVVSRADFILGAHLEEFERAFAPFLGVEHAIGVGSGGDALRLALMALEVGPGNDVIVPANSYIATALAVSSVGARPVLVDCDPSTYNIDVTRVEAALTPRTRAIIPVHFTGLAADMDPILEVASRHGIPVIEDAAQAHGARYKQRMCGAIGAMGCFSFYPSKNLGAYGDGGMVVTNDRELAERVASLRNYGQSEKYIHVRKGLNARLDSLQAAVLLVKLKHLAVWNAAREAHARAYRQLLVGVGDLVFQQCPAYARHIYHLFIVETGRRDALRKYLHDREIQTGIHYPIPIHLQAAYTDLGYREGDFPRAEQLAGRALSLPMFPELTPEQIHYVAAAIREFYAEG